MPVSIIPNGDGTYTVRTPNRVHARRATLKNAKKQAAIINAADAGKPIKPRKR